MIRPSMPCWRDTAAVEMELTLGSIYPLGTRSDRPDSVAWHGSNQKLPGQRIAKADVRVGTEPLAKHQGIKILRNIETTAEPRHYARLLKILENPV